MSLVTLTDQNFAQEVLQADGPVLVDFWASWCSPCLMAAPVIEELAKEYEGKIKVGKLNVDENPQVSAKYQVMSIPTVVMFRAGLEVGRQVGFAGKEGYLDLIKKIIQSA